MTRILLTASSLALAAAGVAATFAPVEIASALGLGTARGTTLIIQLLAAALFAFAMTNWMARGSLMGGIYNRPIAVGNLAHFLIGGLASAKAIAAGERGIVWIVAAAIYIIFAIGFGVVLFRSPVPSRGD